MVIYMTMIMANIHEVKARLSDYVDAALRGERVVICRRNEPVIELRPIGQKRSEPRPVGGGRHTFDVPASFFEPLDGDELDAWEGGAVYPAMTRAPSRVAEAKPDAPPPPRKRSR
jgi:antitoxin (DNA-binding transcriptional repressor) of toxin-antitoxin stability system